MTAELDHLVVACLSLAEARPALEARLGVTDQGGVHVGRGTHNALWALDGAALFGGGPAGACYLELIAPDPDQAPPEKGPMPFGLHRADVRARLADGPRLVAWVARCAAAEPLMAACPEDMGRLAPMKRGDLEWKLTVPPDGMAACGGVVPSLIEWPGGISPAATLPRQGLRLTGFVRRPDPRAGAALAALGLSAALPEGETGGAPMRATVEGPKGAVIFD